MSPEEAMEHEALMMGRAVTMLNARKSVFRDAVDVEHELLLVVYDASTDEHWQTRWAAFIDGSGATSGIVANGSR